MNLQFLGDALDHWKGCVFRWLQEAEKLQAFRVDAMASDAEKWQPQDWTLFAKLLCVKPDQFIAHSVSLAHERRLYLSEIPTNCDVFLDPDTGIQTGSVKSPLAYVRPAELLELMEGNNSRVVVVYQHVRAKKTRHRVEEVLTSMDRTRRGFCCTTYESGTVALLFLSFDSGRVTTITESFRELLGAHAERRVGLWV